MEKLNELDVLVLMVNSKNNPFDNYSTVKDETILDIAKAFRALEQRAEAAEGKAHLCLQNMNDIAHCFSDLRRFIEAKWPTIADLPSCEGVMLSGPENKNEVDAMIASLNRVADFYESAPAINLAELVPDEKPTDIPFAGHRIEAIGWNACRSAILRNIEKRGTELPAAPEVE